MKVMVGTNTFGADEILFGFAKLFETCQMCQKLSHRGNVNKVRLFCARGKKSRIGVMSVPPILEPVGQGPIIGELKARIEELVGALFILQPCKIAGIQTDENERLMRECREAQKDKGVIAKYLQEKLDKAEATITELKQRVRSLDPKCVCDLASSFFIALLTHRAVLEKKLLDARGESDRDYQYKIQILEEQLKSKEEDRKHYEDEMHKLLGFRVLYAFSSF